MKYTIPEIQNMSMEEVNKLSKDELKILVTDTTKKVNSRLNHLRKYFKGSSLPLPTAFREWNVTLKTENRLLNNKLIHRRRSKQKERQYKDDVKKSKGGISYNTLDYNLPENANVGQMRYYFKIMKNFLNSKQGTPALYRKSMNKFYRSLKDNFTLDNKIVKITKVEQLSKKDYKEFWKLYNKIVETHPVSLSSNLSSSEIQRQIYYMYEEQKLSFEDIERIIIGNERKKYETSQESLGDKIDNVLDIGDN